VTLPSRRPAPTERGSRCFMACPISGLPASPHHGGDYSLDHPAIFPTVCPVDSFVFVPNVAVSRNVVIWNDASFASCIWTVIWIASKDPHGRCDACESCLQKAETGSDCHFRKRRVRSQCVTVTRRAPRRRLGPSLSPRPVLACPFAHHTSRRAHSVSAELGHLFASLYAPWPSRHSRTSATCRSPSARFVIRLREPCPHGSL
jgi:hypothetical protein